MSPDKRIGMAASTVARFGTRVLKNPWLSIKTKVYNACVLITLFYGSECWTLYFVQEHIFNGFHMRSLWKLFGISRMSRTSNIVVLFRCTIPTTMLRQRRLLWLGYVRRMNYERITKHILYRSSLLVCGILCDPSYGIGMFASGKWKS